jgi:hypothetical protein
MVVKSPAIDGVLDDACWESASHIEGFWRTEVDAPELERTEAWLCYDQRAVYAAFRCHDTKPGEIRGDQRKRQGRIWADDYVELSLDLENTGRGFHRFCVNAAATQYDWVPGGTSEKIEWKGDWHAAARIDDGGWTAEMKIPFAILRYPQAQDAFRFSLSRRLAREEDYSLWPPEYARVSDTDRCARWEGIATPRVPFRYVLMPYALSVFSSEEEERETLDAGLDFKGTFPNGVVTLATYNPDFRNIEDVVETIDFTFVERYLPDYRPFFQEGQWYFPPGTPLPSNLFYSRRIGEVDLGVKAFGAVGQHEFGLLDIYGRGGENHFAGNYAHAFGTTGSVRISAVDRRVPGEPHNLAYGLGTDWSWDFEGGSRFLSASYERSCTEGGGGDGGNVNLYGGVSRRQGLGWDVGYYKVGSDFRPDDGYVAEQGVEMVFGGLSQRRDYDEGPLQHTSWTVGGGVGDADTGPQRWTWIEHVRTWRAGWGFTVDTNQAHRDGFDAPSYGAGVHWNRKDRYRNGGVSCSWGERYREPYRYLWASQAVRPTNRWSSKLTWEHVCVASLDGEGRVIPPESYRQVVLTNTYDIADDRSVSARLVRSGGDTNVYAAYRQRVRRGMDLLVVAGDPNATEWVSRMAVKAIWCF